MLTEAQLRGVLQLPARPFAETILYDGSRYYDLTHFEPLQILSLTGVYNFSPGYAFVQNTDYAMNSGVVDFGIGGNVPSFGSVFAIDYSYSPLGEATVSTSMWIASTTVQQQLASTYPYASTSAAGVAYNDLATLGMLMVAAREACAAMASSEIVNAVKYRRGAIQMDETEKTKNWQQLSNEWSAKYTRYLAMIRPGGRLSAISLVAANSYNLVFPRDGGSYYAGCLSSNFDFGYYGSEL